MATHTNAAKIKAWREAHPSAELTETSLRDILGLTSLRGADLGGADLRGARLSVEDLRGANLSGARLNDANLRDAKLDGANLRDAHLCDADLRCADMWQADLRGADLKGADLWDADLRGANLSGANLWGANLWGANLWGGLRIQAGVSGEGFMIPTPNGWKVTIASFCDRTLDDLDKISHDRVPLPVAEGVDRDCRPLLKAVKALCEAHIEQQDDDIIAELAKIWGTT